MESLSPTPEFIRTLTAPTKTFLCSLKDNTFGIKFGAFRLRDMTSGITLIDVHDGDLDTAVTEDMDPSTRLLKYHFGPDFLNLRTVGLQVEFKIGDAAVPNLQMIERHYFRGKCIKSFEFKFGFCMPNTTNTLEMIYDMPVLGAEERQEMIGAPWETKSDTFFFVGDKLIIHNRAEYNYAPL